MKRSVLAAIAAIGVFSAIVVHHQKILAFQDEPKSKAKEPAKEPKFKTYSRKARFDIANSMSPEGQPPQVSGHGILPLRLNVSDVGRSQKPHRLQVFAVIYLASAPNTIKTAEKFFVKKHPNILTTGADEDRRSLFEWDIPLLPGDYVAHVFLCDPDVAYVENPSLEKIIPDAQEVPGRVMYGKAISVHVDHE